MPGGKKPCHLWTKACSKAGYGQKWRSGKLRYVHREEWERNNGPIPDGLEVCHSCDTPACYEITHLFLGTHLENVQDAVSKKRMGRKSRTDREELVRRFLNGERSTDLASEFGVHQNTVAKYARQVDPQATKARHGKGRWKNAG